MNITEVSVETTINITEVSVETTINTVTTKYQTSILEGNVLFKDTLNTFLFTII